MVRKEQNLARHPTLYLPTGRSNRVITNTRMRNFTLHQQDSPIHQLRCSQLAMTKHV